MELDWVINTDIVCLIGAGDSGKTTILDAISYALTPKWSLPITDVDFYGAIPVNPIEIVVTVVDPPAELLPEEPKFGQFLRGWSPQGDLHDDPEPSDTLALTVRFTVDSSLEPQWSVFKEAVPEGRPIRSSDRAKMRVFRVDEGSDQHLGWGRGSALAALTGDLDELPSTLAAAHRSARGAFAESSPEALISAAKVAHTTAKEMGAAADEVFQPALDPSAVSHRGSLVLSCGTVPATALGLGSRRLTALAIQAAQLSTGSVVIVDEIEHGLEPHRLRYLLDRLRKSVGEENRVGERRFGQVLLSTHSSVAIEELSAAELYVVQRVGQATKILRVPDAFEPEGAIDPQAIARVGAEALLGRRIVVGEGRTEVGFFRALAGHWFDVRGVPVAHVGTIPVDGGGSHAAARAAGFAQLGFQAALLVDSDRECPRLDEAKKAGVMVLQWEGGTAIEERIALDLPDAGFHELVRLAVEFLGPSSAERAVPDGMANHLPKHVDMLSGLDSERWLEESSLKPEDIRRAFGAAAKKGEWFKPIERGERLGQLVSRHLQSMPETDLVTKVRQLEAFSYGESTVRIEDSEAWR
jgi:putative ATP-dependent endonuclease of the OLD family